MKNSMSKFRIALAACFIVLSYSLSKAETQDSKTRPSFDEKMKIDLFYPVATSYYDLKNQASEIMRAVNTEQLTQIIDTTGIMAVPASAEGSHLPNFNQKLPFAIVSVILIYFFTFLALFSSRFLRDDENKNAESLKTLSFLRISIFTLFFLSLISIPVSIGLHGEIAKTSVSLFLVSAMAGIVLLFHILLKRAGFLNKRSINTTTLKLVDSAFPVLTLVAAFYICLPAWVNLHFAELPVELVISYMIAAMLHVGRKTINSAFVNSTFIKQVFNN
jgi:uncharacterized membrane protein